MLQSLQCLLYPAWSHVLIEMHLFAVQFLCISRNTTVQLVHFCAHSYTLVSFMSFALERAMFSFQTERAVPPDVLI